MRLVMALATIFLSTMSWSAKDPNCRALGEVLAEGNSPRYERTRGSLKKYYSLLNGDEVEGPVSDFKLRAKKIQRLNPANLVGKKVLDAGCGEGEGVNEFNRMGVQAIGLDKKLSPAQKADAEHFVEKDIRNTGLESNHFDFTFSAFSVFFYSESPQFKAEALKELTRVTKEGGWIVIIQGMSEPRIAELEKLAEPLGLKRIKFPMPDRSQLPEAIIFEKTKSK